MILKRIFLFILFISPFNLFSQDHKLSGELNEICSCLETLVNQDLDKVDYANGYEECFEELYNNSNRLSSPDSVDAYLESAFMQLESSCASSRISFEKINELTLQKSKSRITNPEECRILKEGRYVDSTGGTKAIITMKDSVQVMTFNDGLQYTKSKVIWHSECTYSLIFIESTSPFENTMLKPGDERRVEILEVTDENIIIEIEWFDRWFIGILDRV